MASNGQLEIHSKEYNRHAIDQCVVLIGKESVGKSQLVASLTERSSLPANFRGSTIVCENYHFAGRTFVDTPGLLRQSDTATTSAVLGELSRSDVVVLVIQATHIDDDLAYLLPLATGKKGVVVVTFWDKVQSKSNSIRVLDSLNEETGLAFVPVDARKLSHDERIRILAEIDHGRSIAGLPIRTRAGWQIMPSPTLLERKYAGPVVSSCLLILPAVVAVWVANTFAKLLDPVVQNLVSPLVRALGVLPSPLRETLIGNYGLLSMGPLLLLWAMPTVVVYALILGGFKDSGLLDRISVALHPLMRQFGLSGRDLLRVIMGFGCNVPAVISTRACSGCSRGTCISAIAFGSACSYQLGATVGVFAAADQIILVVPYLLYLAFTTMVYIRLTSPSEARSPSNLLLVEERAFLQWPRWFAIWRESRGTLLEFFRKAMPIFILITLTASVLDWLGVMRALVDILRPLMMLFRLPADAAFPVVLASIRKDGILLFAQQDTLAAMSAGQLLVGVYLASVLLPCLVTALTIIREKSFRFVLKMMGRQALAACAFAMILGWLVH